MEIITQSMLFLLESLKNIVGGYGWAIIALTILVRIALWPVSKSQMKSMKMMQQLQPKMKLLQERHKNDPQKLQVEMMKVYKEYKFNPLSGCLPMLVQLPIFFGLYWAISNPHFMTSADPTFLNFIHLKSTGIISHAGPSHDGRMSVSQNSGGGLFGFGKDNLVSDAKVIVSLNNGATFEHNVPNVGEAITVTPKEIHPGVPLQISTSFKQLGLTEYQGLTKELQLSVVNNATHEMEKVTFQPGASTSTMSTTLETASGKTTLHADVLVLIVIFALTMVATQRMMSSQSTAMGNAQQQQLMNMMPLMFTILLFFFPIPSGVLLYMDTNSLFQIFQTWVFNRSDKTGSPESTPPSERILDIKPDTP